jgi:hypothetical protein
VLPEQPAQLTLANSKPFRQRIDRLTIKSAFRYQCQGARNGVRCASPGG